MTNSDDQPLPGSRGWDVYWQGMQRNPGHQSGGTQESELEEFWQRLFSDYLTKDAHCLELAAGSGAVSLQAAGIQSGASLTCSDISPSALQIASQRLPNASMVACDGNCLPFREQVFDLVVSQFGIEYAGQEALLGAAKLVAPGGQLALVVHKRDGSIFREYTRNLAAIRQVVEIQLLSLARGAFTAGFDLNQKRGSVADFKSAEQKFQPAVRALETIFAEYGETIADGLPRQLYRDIAHMYPRMSAYQRQDIMSWLDGVEHELIGYQRRLGSMLDAALDQQTVQSTLNKCEDLGLSVLRQEVLQLGTSANPSGWILVMQRQSA